MSLDVLTCVTCLHANVKCPVSLGNYEGLTPQVAFEFYKTPSVGQIALAFLQASFAFSGWNFLNYVTEEVVDPRRWETWVFVIIVFNIIILPVIKEKWQQLSLGNNIGEV